MHGRPASVRIPPGWPGTAGGREIAATHPEAIAYAFERTAVVVLPGDRWEIIDIGLIESVEGTNEPAPAVQGRDEHAIKVKKSSTAAGGCAAKAAIRDAPSDHLRRCPRRPRRH
jgi:hypothetical protein